MSYTAIYRDTGMWAVFWGTAYAIHCHIQQIQGCGACSRGLYMPYTAIYSKYRDVGPALEDFICHTLPYTAHTGMWALLGGTVYAIYCYIQQIQGYGPCSGGLYMPYTAIYSTYRDVGLPLEDFICHTLPYTAHTGMWGLLWGTEYAIHWTIYSIYRDVGPALGDCICHTLQYTAHTGMWALLWGNEYAIHCHIQQIQGCGPCSGGQYMPYTAIYSPYRDVTPALDDCICHILPYTAHTGMWCLLWRTVYAIYCYIVHIQRCGTCSGGLYMPYSAIYSTYRDVAPALGGLYMAYTAICSTYRDVGPAPGDSICHTLPYTAYTGMWGLLWRTILYMP